MKIDQFWLRNPARVTRYYNTIFVMGLGSKVWATDQSTVRRRATKFLLKHFGWNQCDLLCDLFLIPSEMKSSQITMMAKMNQKKKRNIKERMMSASVRKLFAGHSNMREMEATNMFGMCDEKRVQKSIITVIMPYAEKW